MASNINANNIDDTYPIAGVDNDSQGFRTNFTNIKNNMSYAATEISDLQSKVVLKQGLTGTTLNNDFGGSPLSGAEIYAISETEYDQGTVGGNIYLNFAVAHYHKVSTGGNINVVVQNLPATGKVARLRLRVNVVSTAHTMTLPTSATIGAGTIEGLNTATNVLTFPATGIYLFELLTNDQGTTFIVEDLLRPRRVAANSFTWANSTVSTYQTYTYANVGNNFSVTVTNTLYIDSNRILNMGNVYLPSPEVDGQLVTISSNNAIQTLYVRSNAGSLILGNVSTLSANSTVKFQYVSGGGSVNKWFKY